MPDFKRLFTGDYPSSSVQTANVHNEDARLFNDQEKLGVDESIRGLAKINPAEVVIVFNNTGGDLAAYTIVKQSGTPITDLTVNPGAVARNPYITGVVPTSSTDYICVLLDPIPNGQYGRAVIDGVCMANVQVNSTSDTFAASVASTTANAISGSSGQLRILNALSATGTQLCLCQLTGAKIPSTAAAYQIVYLSGNQSISATSAAALTGMTVTLPKGHVYIVFAKVTVKPTLDTSSSLYGASYAVIGTSPSAPIQGGFAVCACNTVQPSVPFNDAYGGTGTIVTIVDATLSASDIVLNLYGYLSSTGIISSNYIGTSDQGATSLGWFRLGS